jgi:hypothetical protein
MAKLVEDFSWVLDKTIVKLSAAMMNPAKIMPRRFFITPPPAPT